MSKIDAFVKVASKDINRIQFAKLKDEEYKKEVAKKLVEAFSSVYGGNAISTHDCVEDEGFVMVPATLKNKAGEEYIALLDLCVQDAGEHYGTQIFHPDKGIVNQNDFRERLSPEELEKMFPYQYRPFIQIIGDIHTSSYY